MTLTQDAATGTAALESVVGQGSRQEKGKKAGDEYSVTMRYEERNPPEFARQTIKAEAAADGRWTAVFDPAKASFRPTWIIAESGGQTLAVENVLIGEVWVCAGQSNMGWGNFNRKTRVAGSSDFPGLRYVAWHDSWYKPLDDVRNNIHWRECSPASAEDFSAVPYLYGMFLHRYLKVPLGIINVARGGTTGDTWCLREELDGLQHVTVKETLRKYDAETATWNNPAEVERIMAEWEQAVADKKAEHEKAVAKAKAEGKKEPRLRLPKQPGDPRRGWSPPAALFNATVVPIRHLGVRGVLYYQGENNVFGRWTRYEHTFAKVPVSFRKAYVYFDSDPVVHERWKHIENNASWQVLPQPYQGKAPIEGFIIAGRDRRWYPAKAQEKRIDGTWTIEVWSDLVAEPVAVRYGWANWPTGNLVGRERLPVPTFRTDDWPIVKGVSYSEEAKKASNEKIKAMQAEAARLALDRKLRQMQIDLPNLEKELHKRDAGGQLRSKLDRIEGILEDLQTDQWLAGQIAREHPELVDKITGLAGQVEKLQAAIPAE